MTCQQHSPAVFRSIVRRSLLYPLDSLDELSDSLSFCHLQLLVALDHRYDGLLFFGVQCHATLARWTPSGLQPFWLNGWKRRKLLWETKSFVSARGVGGRAKTELNKLEMILRTFTQWTDRVGGGGKRARNFFPCFDFPIASNFCHLCRGRLAKWGGRWKSCKQFYERFVVGVLRK